MLTAIHASAFRLLSGVPPPHLQLKSLRRRCFGAVLSRNLAYRLD